MQKKGKNLGALSAFVIALLSLGGFVGAATMVVSNQGTLVFSASADDNEGGDSESDEERDDEENKDNDGDKKEKEKERENEKKKSESVKKASERERETERERSVSGQDDDSDVEEDEDSDDNDDEDGTESESGEVEDDSEDDSDDNGMFRDRTKTMTKLEKEIAEAEKEILEKQAEGVDVTAALARLAQAKAAALLVGSAFDANDLEAAKELSKSVKKLTHFAREEDLHDAKKIAEDTAKVAKRIAQAEKKLVALKALGGDTASFEVLLSDVRAMFAEAKQLIAQGGTDLLAGSVKLEAAEEKAKDIKDSIENALFALGGEDDDFDDEHEDEVEDIAENLDDVADMEEGSVGQQVRTIAREQRSSAARVSALMRSAEDRSAIAEFLVGSKTDDIDGIQSEIATNSTRIAVLTRAAEQVSDPDVRSILEDQIAALKTETAQLQNFVAVQLGKNGLFGWLANLF